MGEVKLKKAILETLAYSDIFEYPLDTREIQRYLGCVATEAEIDRALRQMAGLARNNGHFALPDRTGHFSLREERSQAANVFWRKTHLWSWLIAHIPFVRMVAITGTLAVDNVEDNGDVDYLIVTEPERLWLCRAMILGLDRISRWFGVTLCPNYLITTNALHFEDHSLFTARELTQMVPLSGMSVYGEIRKKNNWVNDWLPNAEGIPRPEIRLIRVIKSLQALLELPLRNSLGKKLEAWEMERKISKFHSQNPNAIETSFSANYCKGHFDGHGTSTQEAYASRLESLKDSLV
ncbi:MAG: hypothetical protein DWQ07_02140 [Chloroflexi bacterium]|nr:MAG: hypothetical protein DWQ07_02140 [Chloroflexota bacterium]MBL1193702.1 hypothetical protein [Chloroflexota bacterium]NOH10995.1 hypothetical protein [Chloroflexota bacterium]